MSPVARDRGVFVGTMGLEDDARVDFVNGFVETYRDSRSAKGAAESLVCVKDMQLNPLMQKLAARSMADAITVFLRARD